jgi:adenosylcobyric acid synthase
MRARALMVLGTGSDVGKSLVVAGLCRAFADRGLRVRPFKPQNMSNNAAVTADGGEIGRAQALQALACRVPPTVHMNPVLLKPQSRTGSQIVLQGRVFGQAEARAYQAIKPTLMPAVLESFARLRAEADLVVVEGAGSAAEANLRANDIANLGFARAADVPCLLVGDIDRGGVIAQILGTRHALDEADAAMIRGFIVNRMRGDLTLFADGMEIIASKTGWPALGLVPHAEIAGDLPKEDSLGLGAGVRRADAALRVAVLAYPRISNFDDLDPLAAEPAVDLVVLRPGEALPGDRDLVILPGSKATIADLDTLRAYGWEVDLLAHHRRGGRILGLCGGYQMLGRSIADPLGIEGPPGRVAGLGLLDVETTMAGDKTLIARTGRDARTAAPLTGYEMHIGRTHGPDVAARPFARLDDGGKTRPDGAVSADGRVAGTYLHGLFDDAGWRGAWLAGFGAATDGVDQGTRVEAALAAVAAHLEAHCDLDAILSIAR